MITEQGYARLRGVLRRRRLPILAVSAATLVIGAAIITALEPRYAASAVVRVLESQPAKEYVVPSVIEQTGERLRTLRLGLMSRPLLAQIAEEKGLLVEAASKESVIEDMRARIDVKVEGEDTFLVTYEDPDAERAQVVVNALAERFMKQQVEHRSQVARATRDALDGEAQRLRPEVEKLGEKVREFKLAHYGALPEQQEQNLRILDQTTMEVNIQSTNLDMAQERRRMLIASNMSPLRHQEDELMTALNEARMRYTTEHPEVRRIQHELTRVHDARVREEKELRVRMRTNNPELIGLEGDIRRTESMIKGLRERQTEVRARVLDTAKNAHELARLQADYDTVSEKYQAVAGRLREADLAAQLELGLKDHRYELVEGAVLPVSPAKPNRPLLALAALLVAAVLGLGSGFLLDRADGRIYSPGELNALSHAVPLLACVPKVAPEAKGHRRER